jgi:uncharacterized repeat protein (TIGR04076 family)
MGHFKAGEGEAFWKAFKEAMKYDDQEMEYCMNSARAKWAPKMASPAIQDSTMIIEVVHSHGCANGLKPGDKLVFQGCGLLDPKRSDPWCASAMNNIMMLSNVMHNLILHDIDPNDIYANCNQCADCGSKWGWGEVVMKVRVVKEPGYTINR